MKRIATLLGLTISLITSVAGGQLSVSNRQDQLSPPDKQQIDRFIDRSKDEKLHNLAANALWSLMHNYSDERQVHAVSTRFQSFLDAFDEYRNGNPANLNNLGGVKAFTEQLTKWLDSSEQCVRGFAATMLAIYGDSNYAAQIAGLFKKADEKNDSIAIDRYAAAVALGVLGAREYTDTLVKMLSSKNEYDRAGAAISLGWMQTKDKADAIARLLKDDNAMVRAAAKDALEMLNTKP